MTEQEIEQNIAQVKKIWVGKQVKVKGKHPHAGEIGEVVDFQKAGMTGRWGLVVKSETSEFFVFDVSLLFVIP